MTIITTHPFVTLNESGEIIAVAGRLRIQAQIQHRGFAIARETHTRQELIVIERNGILKITDTRPDISHHPH